jgi:hypothetical protein
MNIAFTYPRLQATPVVRRCRGFSFVTRPLLALVAAFLVVGCHPSPLEPYRATSAASSISVGQQIDFWMGTVGPGSYVSPPTLNGSAIEFLGVTSPPGSVPSGAQQIFHFKGVAGGTSIIVFQNTNPDKTHYPDVSDTVSVR